MNNVNVVRLLVALGALGVLFVSLIGVFDAERFDLPRGKDGSSVMRIAYFSFAALSLFVITAAVSLRHRSYRGKIVRSDVELIELLAQREVIRIEGLERTLIVMPSMINAWRAAGLDIDDYVLVTYYDSFCLPFLAPTIDSFERVDGNE